ncbi:FxLD family lanthipeptide [Streptosporangium sp. NPDC051022]|uniref:FxLD family lanthipeptide n=1 Tax=Streptosporangium sp. NPDC051022 TaxID=3155752 RepID=UPI00341B64F8
MADTFMLTTDVLDTDPFELDVTVTTEVGGDRMPKACGTSDGCAPTCASSCASAV